MQMDGVADLQQQVVPPLWTTRDVSLRAHKVFRCAGGQQEGDRVTVSVTNPFLSVSSSGRWASIATVSWRALPSGMWCSSTC